MVELPVFLLFYKEKMKIIYVIILWIACASFALQGFTIDAQAKSIMHQLYAGIHWLAAAVCFGFSAVVSCLPETKPLNKEAIRPGSAQKEVEGAEPLGKKESDSEKMSDSMAPCRYCGKIVSQSARFCSNCKIPLAPEK